MAQNFEWKLVVRCQAFAYLAYFLIQQSTILFQCLKKYLGKVACIESI